jgi:hypothetical protein
MTDENGLFDGVGSTNGTDVDAEDPVAPENPLDPKVVAQNWLSHLSWREVHAFVIGFAPILLALVAIGTRYTPHWVGDVLVVSSLALTGATLAGLRLVPGEVGKVQIREPHYLLFGQVVATLLGATLLLILRVLALLVVVLV